MKTTVKAKADVISRLISYAKRTPPALATRDAIRELKTLKGLVRPLQRDVRATALLARSEPVEVRRYTVPNEARLESLASFSRWLSAEETLPQGQDSVYLTPAKWASSALASVKGAFPEGYGLKISKSVGDLTSPYMTMRSGRWLQRQLSGAHLLQVKTFEHLHALGLGPRLCDLLEIVDGRGAIRVGYVVEHIDGCEPTPDEFRDLVAQLQDMCARGRAALISGSGWKGSDFQLPDGNGNAIRCAADGKVKYIDVHSFRVFS